MSAPSPPVDGLVRVSHRAEVPVPLGYFVHEDILRPVGILILVNEYMDKALLGIFSSILGSFSKSLNGGGQEVAEVNGVHLTERLLISWRRPFGPSRRRNYPAPLGV